MWQEQLIPRADLDPDTPAPIIAPTEQTILTHRGTRHTVHCDDSRTLDPPPDARVLVWDPPWDAPQPWPDPRAWPHILAFGDGSTLGRIVSALGAPTWSMVWDCVSSWWTPHRPLRRHKMCLWYGPLGEYDPDAYKYGPATAPKQVSNSRGSYHYAGDPQGRRVADLYVEPITALHGRRGAHPHAKPQSWLASLIACTSRSGAVYDPYGGGGSTLAACMEIGRASVTVEMDPGWASAAIRAALARGAEITRP